MCMHVSTVGSGLGWVVNVPHPAVGVVPQPTHPDALGGAGRLWPVAPWGGLGTAR